MKTEGQPLRQRDGSSVAREGGWRAGQGWARSGELRESADGLDGQMKEKVCLRKTSSQARRPAARCYLLPPAPPAVSSLPQSLKPRNAGKTIDGGCLGQHEETERHGLPIACECRNEPDSNNALSTSHHCHCTATESGDGRLRSFVKRQKESE